MKGHADIAAVCPQAHAHITHTAGGPGEIGCEAALGLPTVN